MKIIQLIYAIGPGGAEKFVVDLSNQLSLRGHDVIYCMLLSETLYPNEVLCKQKLSSNVRFVSLGFRKGFTLTKLWNVQKFINTEKPDIVHCHLNVIPYIYPLALFSKKVKIIHTLHSMAENTLGTKVQFYLNRFFYSHNLIRPVTISSNCQKSYEHLYNLFNATVINNGCVNITPSENIIQVRNEVDSYKKNRETKVFIHVARFNRLKNQKLLIDSFNALSKIYDNFILLIVGDGFQNSEAESLVNKACDNIKFLGVKSNVGDYLFCSDAFCLTSIIEGLPISLLEAFCCGVTPICTPVGGITNVVVNGQSGYLSSDISLASYLSAIKQYLNKPISRAYLRDIFMSKYSIDICAQQYESFFKK